MPNTTFLDGANRTWNLGGTMHVATWKRVRETTGIKLWELGQGGYSELAKLLEDLPLFVDVLAVILEEVRETAGVSDEAFGRSMAGPQIEAAADAFIDVLAECQPTQNGQRAAFAKMVEAARARRAAVAEFVESKLAVIDVADMVKVAINPLGAILDNPQQ